MLEEENAQLEEELMRILEELETSVGQGLAPMRDGTMLHARLQRVESRERNRTSPLGVVRK